MPPVMVVIAEVSCQSPVAFSAIAVGVKIDVFVFHTAQKPFDEDIVQRASFSVHA